MLQIKIGDNYSLNMLRAYVENGNVLSMTPHAGNRRLNELMLGSIGANCRTVFTNQIIKDVLDKPHLLIEGGEETCVVSQTEPVLTPYSTFSSDFDTALISERFDLGELRTPSQMIYKSLKKVQGDSFEFAQEALYLEDADFANRFLEILIAQDFSLFRISVFDRKVYRDGKMSRAILAQDKQQIQSFFDYFQVLTNGIREGVSIDFPGVQVANMVNVLGDFVQTLYNRKTAVDFKGQLDDDVLLLSGPSMYKYVKNKKNLGFLRAAYAVLAVEFDLPQKVNCVYVPFSEFEFLQASTNTAYNVALEDFLDAFDRVSDSQLEFRNPALNQEQKGALIAQSKALRAALKEEQQLVQSSVCEEFFTQYDAILNPQEVLEFPEALSDFPIAQLKKFEFLAKAKFNQ